MLVVLVVLEALVDYILVVLAVLVVLVVLHTSSTSRGAGTTYHLPPTASCLPPNSVESKLFLGGVTRHANGTAGLHRLVPKRGGTATATATAAGNSAGGTGTGAGAYDLVPVAASALLAPGAGSGGRWKMLAALAALGALCACTLLARRRGRAGRPHRYGLPGDTDLVQGCADDERGDDLRPQSLAAYRDTLGRETLGSPIALLGSPIALERYGAESRHARPGVAEGQGAVEYF